MLPIIAGKGWAEKWVVAAHIPFVNRIRKPGRMLDLSGDQISKPTSIVMLPPGIFYPVEVPQPSYTSPAGDS